MSSILKPPASMVIGATGTGKTYSISTYLKAGIETFVLVTEPTGVDTLLDSVKDQDLDMSLLHWKLCRPGSESFDTLIKQAEVSNRKTASDMQKMENGLDKRDYPQYINFLQACANFTCDRTGEEYGDITTWDASRALVLDSLSGVNVMVSRNQCGNRLTMTQPEFGICQSIIENLMNTMTGLDCFFTLMVHPEYERDEITGQQRIMSSTLGKKLAPKIPRFFSEIVWAYKDGKKFRWSTEHSIVDTKARILPIDDALAPSFVNIVNGYNARKRILEEFNKETTNTQTETSEQTAA